LSNKKLLASSIAGLGILCIAVGVFQLNQYYTTSAAASQTLKQLDELSASQGTASGFTAEDVAQTRQATENTLNSLLLSALADFAVGATLFAGGYLFYPSEKS